MTHIRKDVKFWVCVGNSLLFFNVMELHYQLVTKLFNVLPAVHTLIGFDYNPYFYRKGKSRVFTTLKSCDKYIDAFERTWNTGELSSILV